MLNLKTLSNKKTFKYPITLRLPDAINEMDDIDILNNYNVNKIRDNKYCMYVCFNYALHNKNIMDLETAFEYTLYNYKPIELKDARVGDMITFHKIERQTRGLRIPNELNIEHLGIISDINIENNTLKIKSKWGDCGIFEGDIDLLPVFYGDTFVIWRKKQNKNNNYFGKMVN